MSHLPLYKSTLATPFLLVSKTFNKLELLYILSISLPPILILRNMNQLAFVFGLLGTNSHKSFTYFLFGNSGPSFTRVIMRADVYYIIWLIGGYM